MTESMRLAAFIAGPIIWAAIIWLLGSPKAGVVTGVVLFLLALGLNPGAFGF